MFSRLKIKDKRSKLLYLFLFLFFVSTAFATTYQTPGVIVTATRLPEQLAEQPWSVTIFSKKEIENSGAATVGELVKCVAGIDSSGNGYSGGSILARIRGASSQQTLILIDGRRINSPTLGLTDLGIIPIENIEKIEIIKAPLSSVYGSDAVGGVVNIITKSGQAKENLKIASGLGGDDDRSILLSLTGKNYFLSIKNALAKGFRANSDYDAKTYSASYSFDKFRLTLSNYEDKKGSPGSTFFPSTTAGERNNNYFFALSGKEVYGANFNSYLNIFHNRYIDSTYFVNSSNLTRSYGFEVSRPIEFSTGRLILGGDLRREVATNSDSGSHNLTNAAVYFQHKHLLPRGYFHLGWRLDTFKNSSSHGSPSIGLVLYQVNDIIMKLSWAGAFKMPTMNDLYWPAQSFTYFGTTYTTVGNPNLRAEIGHAIDLSFEKEWNDNYAKITLFENKIKDLIRWETTTTATSVTYQPVNIVNAEINGIELEVSRKLNRYLSANLNYTWQDAANEAPIKVLTYSPKNKYNLSLSYDHPALFLKCQQRFVGKRFTDLLNTTELPGYAVFDILAARKLDHGKIKGRIENLFAVNYQEVSGYPQPGRRYYLGAEYFLDI
ncbi:TonB-dependent receptor plug domain-containing protein [Candidatus Margulisiibacteriota bacterium]